MARGENPILVEVWRGGAVESRHRGAAVVMDSDGNAILAWGDGGAPVFPRSAIKPVQALALLETGAAARFDVSAAELALASSSHNGEDAHVDAVHAWLARMGLGDDALECGAHAPYLGAADAAMRAAGRTPTRAHNNCSGKHAGMLATALAMGVSPRGYSQAEHPVQRRVRDILSEMSGHDHTRAEMGIDGCGIPTYATPLASLARAIAHVADPRRLAPARADAVARIRRAVAAHPHMVAGTGRFCTQIMTAAGEAILVKTGAEGVFAAALPGRGLGIALKIDDGATRASECAMASLLLHLVPGVANDALDAYARKPLANWAGTRVGEVRAAPGWPN